MHLYLSIRMHDRYYKISLIFKKEKVANIKYMSEISDMNKNGKVIISNVTKLENFMNAKRIFIRQLHIIKIMLQEI